MLRVLKEEKIPKAMVSPTRTAEFSIVWSNPEATEPNNHKAYLDRFCAKFEEKLYEVIKRSVQKNNNLVSDDYVMEVVQHLQMCKTRADMFRGREDVLGKIQDYVLNHSQQPFVIHGVSGSGKTSVMGKVASLIGTWMPDVEPITVLRFLGR